MIRAGGLNILARSALTHSHSQDDEACENGSASLETVIVVPIILMLVLGMLEAGLYMHTRNMALRAATAAAVGAAAWQSTNADGVTAGQAVIDQTLSSSASVTLTRTDTQVIATVTADSPTIIGVLLDQTVTQSAAAPIERWTQ